LDVPDPKLCFHCRLQRRLAFFNRRKLYRRTCGYSGKEIISIFSPDKPFVVYDKEIWHSDVWDPKSFGRPVDFSKPFFDQFCDLLLAVPHQSLAVVSGTIENSDYVNDCLDVRLISDTH